MSEFFRKFDWVVRKSSLVLVLVLVLVDLKVAALAATLLELSGLVLVVVLLSTVFDDAFAFLLLFVFRLVMSGRDFVG